VSISRRGLARALSSQSRFPFTLRGESSALARTRSLRLTLGAIIRLSDPDFNRDRRSVLGYEFSNGRKFYHDPNTSGPYSYSPVIEIGGSILSTEADEDVETGSSPYDVTDGQILEMFDYPVQAETGDEWGEQDMVMK
jgi:hypothetical protein